MAKQAAMLAALRELFIDNKLQKGHSIRQYNVNGGW